MIALTGFLIVGYDKGERTADIQLIWEPQHEAEASRIDRFSIRYSLDNVIQEPIEVKADVADYSLANVAQGSYGFQVIGLSGDIDLVFSSPVTLDVTNGSDCGI